MLPGLGLPPRWFAAAASRGVAGSGGDGYVFEGLGGTRSNGVAENSAACRDDHREHREWEHRWESRHRQVCEEASLPLRRPGLRRL